jgi:archaellum biogenesis ATPase FlaH
MTRNEAAAAKPIDQSMPNLLEKHPLQTLTPQPQAHHAPPVASQPQSQPQREAFLEGTVSSWLNEAKAQPPITPLFDAFWLKGELAFMFGSAGIGKSILAFQIADAIAKGAKIQNFDGPQTPMKVGYFDFELSARQLLRRYSDENGNVYQFSDNFWRFEISPDLSIPKGMNSQDFLLSEIEKSIIKHRLEVVVIDSLTHLPIFITEKTNARSIMRRLHLIKSRQNISMLVVGHSMRQDLSQPITEYDLVCSIFCDSAFAIGESAKEKNVRYLKQIKTDSARLRYDIGYAAVFRLVKRNRFIGFEHIDFDCEYEHL